MEEAGEKPFSWDCYPVEFTDLILSLLSYQELARCRTVCRIWSEVGRRLEGTPTFLKDRFLVKWNEFIQVDEECTWPKFAGTDKD
jgi:hypothetical protein